MLPTAVKLPAAVGVGDGAGGDGTEGDGTEGDGAAGDEVEGVADLERFAHPVGRNSRPSERANTILENRRCFCNCDFMAKSPIKLIALRLHAYPRREFCASFEASLFVNFCPGLEKGQWMPSDNDLPLGGMGSE